MRRRQEEKKTVGISWDVVHFHKKTWYDMPGNQNRPQSAVCPSNKDRFIAGDSCFPTSSQIFCLATQIPWKWRACWQVRGPAVGLYHCYESHAAKELWVVPHAENSLNNLWLKVSLIRDCEHRQFQLTQQAKHKHVKISIAPEHLF